jgi:nucleotide-binding universal stress UspA family protein
VEIELRRVCVPTDFSVSAEWALHYAAALAEKFGAELHLLHVLQDPEVAVAHPDFTARNEAARTYFRALEQLPPDEESAPRTAEREPLPDEATRAFLKSLEADVGRLYDQLPAVAPWWERLSIVRATRFGHPVEEICRYARRHGVGLLVLGTHGRSGLRRVLLGSVAERVVRTAPCPVLTVRHPQFEFVIEP